MVHFKLRSFCTKTREAHKNQRDSRLLSFCTARFEMGKKKADSMLPNLLTSFPHFLGKEKKPDHSFKMKIDAADKDGWKTKVGYFFFFI